MFEDKDDTFIRIYDANDYQYEGGKHGHGHSHGGGHGHGHGDGNKKVSVDFFGESQGGKDE